LGEGHSRQPFLFLFWKGRGIRNCWDMESNNFFSFVKGVMEIWGYETNLQSR
jgi:hypothetical protein